MAEQHYLTQTGKEDLEKELQKLINKDRIDLAAKLKEAVAQGDLKENADYHDAKEKQALLEGRIHYLESVLRSAKIIDNDGTSDEIVLGSTVTIREKGTKEDESYMIVGAAEANPREGKISNESPIGEALLGHKVGDSICVKTPAGEVIFKIREIS